ncbi:MAG: putative salt-induced outer membrane protein [Phenylobacterium sp.]|jgi:putative salt-induced outer membrane protein
MFNNIDFPFMMTQQKQPDISVKSPLTKLTILLPLLFCGGAIAQEGAQKEVQDKAQNKAHSYRGDVELGIIMTTGNTETASARVAADVEQEFTDWRIEYVIDAQYQRSQFDTEMGRSERETTEQQVFLSYQGNYKLEQANKSFFIFGSYNDDRFNGYDYQLTAATGYGWRFYDSAQSTIDVEVGPGYVWNELDNGSRRQGTILRSAVKYEQKLTEATKFRQDVVSEISFNGESSTTKAESSMLAQINGRLALKVSFLIEYNSKPEEQRKKIDTETGITLVYSF